MISMIQGEVVTRYNWLTMGQFTDIVAISQMTPGPIGINSATYVGYTSLVNAGYSHAMGVVGSATATFAVVLPSFILMLLISKFLLKFKNHPIVENIFLGLRPAVIGLIAAAALLLLNRENFGTSDTPWQFYISIFIFVTTFIGTYVYKINPILLICSAGVAGFLLFLFIIGRYKHTGWVYGAAVYLFLGGTGGCLMSWQQGKTVFPFSGKPAVYRVCIREHPEERERSILCRVALLGEVEKDTVTGCPRNHLFLAYFPKDSATATLRRGDELLVSTRLVPPANNGNPDEFDYARYLRRKGYSGTAYVADGHWRKTGHDASRTVSQVALDYRAKVVGLYRSLGFEADELAVLSALTVGDKEELSDDIVETYSVSGASHVLALSGLHIGFLYALLLFVLRPLWRRWRRLKPLLLLLLVLFLVSFATSPDMATIGNRVKIVNTKEITNTVVYDDCEIAGAARLSDCTLMSNSDASVYIGTGVICENSIISNGSAITNSVKMQDCFVGEACKLSNGFTAAGSVFFANSYMANGEACAAFCGPFTASHHKSSLLIGGQFSFYNAGSATNFSNHAYKMGPMHYGTLERGSKTASGAYILMPAHIGAFSVCFGKLMYHPDTRSLPFSRHYKDAI